MPVRRISRTVLHSLPYRATVLFFIILSILGDDLIRGWLEPEADRILVILLTAAFLVLLSESLLTILAVPSWWKKGGFWLITVASMTMLLDLDWFILWAFVDVGGLFPLLPVRLMRPIRMVSRLGRMMRVLRIVPAGRRGPAQEGHLQLWGRLESAISYGTMICFLFVYVMISGLGILQTLPLSPVFLRAQVYLEEESPAEGIPAFAKGAPELLYFSLGGTVYADREGRIKSLRVDELLKRETPAGLLVVDNAAAVRKTHRQSLFLTGIFFLAMLFMNFFIHWVIRRYGTQCSLRCNRSSEPGDASADGEKRGEDLPPVEAFRKLP